MLPKLFSTAWKIVTVTEPVMFHRTYDEVWLLNPGRRYILNADQVEKVSQWVDTCSDFAGASLHNPLRAGQNLANASLLIERVRDRGIGDLLFLTAPIAFMQHACGRLLTVDLYALSDRGQVLTHNQDLRNGCVLAGPIEYDHLRNYAYHWFVESVTEWDEEPDQHNVYDALYAQLGFSPDQIDSEWKRPRATCVPQDYKHLDQFFYSVWNAKHIDLRRTGYYVVAPFASASIRAFDYQRWLTIIKELSQRRPVVVIGTTRMKLPDTSISVGEFHQQLGGMGNSVINAIDGTPLRILMALISRAKGFVGLDSGPLYIAQGLRTPAVSIWGSHHPGVRIGYDKTYMDLAVWKGEACPHAPCFAYLNFPASKCPEGKFQAECSVYKSVTPSDVLSKVDIIEQA
jgi:hypothetical protein